MLGWLIRKIAASNEREKPCETLKEFRYVRMFSVRVRHV